MTLQNTRIRRSRSDRMISGVAAGLAREAGIDTGLMRIFWVLAVLLTGGAAIALYAACWLILPEEASVA